MDGLMVVASDLQTLGYSVEKTFRVMKTFFFLLSAGGECGSEEVAHRL